MAAALPVVIGQPVAGRCSGCGAEVVRAVSCAGEVTLELAECLPRMKCPCCRGKDRRCVRCGGRGWIGDVLPHEAHATLDERGWAHLCHAGRTDRRPGQAMHRIHHHR